MKTIDLTMMKFKQPSVASKRASVASQDEASNNAGSNLLADVLAFVAVLFILAVAAANVILFMT